MSLRWVHRSFCWFCRAAAHVCFQRELDTSQYKISPDKEYVLLPHDIQYVSTVGSQQLKLLYKI